MLHLDCCRLNCWTNLINNSNNNIIISKIVIIMWVGMCVCDGSFYSWCARQMFDQMTAYELGNFLFFVCAFAFGSSTACCLKRLVQTANLVDPFQPIINYMQSNGSNLVDGTEIVYFSSRVSIYLFFFFKFL